MSLSDAGARIAVQEARLITQIADGNLEEPMQELCHRYEKSLYGFGAHILGDEALAEVMVQEIFQRLWRTAGRFDPASDNPRAFLFGIARSVGAEIRASRLAGAGRPARESSLPPLPDSVDAILDAVAVREAFGTLSAPRAEVLRLALEDGLTQPEIAQRLEVPLDTVTARTLHGMQALRAALGERVPGEWGTGDG